MKNARQRKRSHLWGIASEYLCMALLVCKGYSILETRHRNRAGEIDIIAARGDTVVFIEVKARKDKTAALESVSVDKQSRIARAATAYIASHSRYAHHSLRLDVMVVTSLWNIHHLKDAWRM